MIIPMVYYNNLSDARRHGIYYTPSHLANFLVTPLINRKTLSIFDPAYGEGSLLLATENIANSDSANRHLALFGCDRAPVNGLLQHLPSSHLIETDFFDYFSDDKFDVIVMNPPFVRHHLIDREKRKNYQKIIAGIYPIKGTSDLWAYFLVKSCLHLKKGGNIGAILPWSFLQADYAQDIRKWLAENFEEIKVLALSAEFFNDAQERIVMLWLKGYSRRAKSISISFSAHISGTIDYSELSQQQWNTKKILYSSSNNIQTILDEYSSKHNFKNFEEYGRVKIGVVTGADSFFILDEELAKKNGFTKKYSIPIFSSSKEFAGFFLNGNVPSKKLIKLSGNGSDKFKTYILEGMKSGYHLRAHSLLREPWYCVDRGRVPDAFFPYRAMQIPYMVLNNNDAQCTNSIHRVYFNKGLSITEKKWIQISLLSIPGQLSIEARSKTYGSGVLKIEPSSLKSSIVYKCRDKSVNTVYNEVSKCLSLNQKMDAMYRATEFINERLNVSKDLSDKAHSTLIELQNRRLDR